MDLEKQRRESVFKLARERHEQLMRDDPKYRDSYNEFSAIMEAVSAPSQKSE